MIGRDSLGAPIELHGATFLRSLIQVQLDRFYIYWDRTNLGSTDADLRARFSDSKLWQQLRGEVGVRELVPSPQSPVASSQLTVLRNQTTDV